jgi:UDP-N-acetylglucosamine 2-epimerase (non-hydrolysing)
MKILLSFGTRPDNIRDIPIKLLFTGQHINLIEDINVDYIINIEHNAIQSNRLNDIWCSILKHNYIFNEITHVIVQGDTTSAVAVAMSAFHNGVKVIHLEAGLRTHNIYDPYPEELNRQLISRIATIHLCPTELNKENLFKENIKHDIYVVGNTGLDNIEKNDISYNDTVLITLHRRDNHNIINKWFIELSKIAKKYNNLEFIFPLHPNPVIQQYKNLLEGITILKPLTHIQTINIIKKCKFIISDSGGIQEEASYLNKKIIVCRKSTERPEIIGTNSILCKNPIDLESCVDLIYKNYIINVSCPYKPNNSPVFKKIIDILKNYENK